MDPYSYMNAIIDSNPTIVRLVLSTEPTGYGVSPFDAAQGPAPEGQPVLTDRAAIEAAPAGQDFSEGFDADGNLIARFVC